MTVPKHKRKQSKLEFMHNYYKIRDQMTFVLMNDFGYSRSKAEARISHKYFHNVPRAELPEPEKILFDEYLERSDRVQSDNKRRKQVLATALSDSASSFANANGNGNANCNNASNTNGVRPDFEQSAHLAINSAAN